MTPEEQELLERISNLRAERDSLREKCERLDSACFTLELARASSADAIAEVMRDRDMLLSQRDAIAANLDEERADLNALRERVKGRETKLATALKAESRLAAIRQWVSEARDLLGDTSDNATKAWRLLVEADDILGDAAPAPKGPSDPPLCSRCHGATAEVASECSHCDGSGWEPESGVAAIASVIAILDPHDGGARARILKVVWGHVFDTPRPAAKPEEQAPDLRRQAQGSYPHPMRGSSSIVHPKDCGVVGNYSKPTGAPETCCGHGLSMHEAADGCTVITDQPEVGDVCPCPRSVVDARPEPSTAEAFATLKAAGLMRLDEHERAALALLERRMGAQATLAEALRNGGVYLSTIRDALTRGRGKDATRGDFVSALAALEAYEKPVTQWLLALTDAPPVFTLEEIERAAKEVAGDAEPGGDGVESSAAAESYAEGWKNGAEAVRAALVALRNQQPRSTTRSGGTT